MGGMARRRRHLIGRCFPDARRYSSASTGGLERRNRSANNDSVVVLFFETANRRDAINRYVACFRSCCSFHDRPGNVREYRPNTQFNGRLRNADRT